MAMVVNTNTLSLNAQNNLNKSQQSLNSAIERLSSGSRINSAKDDAAGQAIANRMTAQVTGMNQASRNANDGISMVQTMEGGMDKINDNLQRVRELSVQAASDTNTGKDRDAIATEINERLSEIDRLANSSNFNGTNLLNVTGDGTSLSIQIGAGTTANDKIDVDRVNMTTDGLGLDASVTATDGGFDRTAATALIDNIDDALDTLNTSRATLGATLNRFDSVVENLAENATNLSAARSRIEDADYATEVSNMSKAQILQQAGTSVLAQANQTTQGVLSLLR